MCHITFNIIIVSKYVILQMGGGGGVKCKKTVTGCPEKRCNGKINEQPQTCLFYVPCQNERLTCLKFHE